MDTPKSIDRTRIHNVTIEEVRACPLFEDCTDEEALEVIDTLKKLATIAYNYYQKQRKIVEK